MSDTTICQHNSYWRTNFGNCMACRAEKAERELAAEREVREKAEAQVSAQSGLLMNIADTCRSRGFDATQPLDERVIGLAHRMEQAEAKLSEVMKALSSGLCSVHREPDPLHCDICNVVTVLDGANATRMKMIESLEARLNIAREALEQFHFSVIAIDALAKINSK